MANTIQPTTQLEVGTNSPEVPYTRGAEALRRAAASFGLDWSPRHAWELRALWGPVARAVESIVEGSHSDPGNTIAFRVLAIGRRSETLGAMLAHAAARGLGFEVHPVDLVEEVSLPFEIGAFDCAIAVDWLPFLRSSQRQRAVSELCRVARTGVVLANPFHTPEVADAERGLNALHFAATGKDNLELGRHIECGLPDLDATRAWVSTTFAHLATEPVDSLATWQALASLAVLDSPGREITAMDVAAAALLPPVNQAVQPPTYRTLIVASSSPLPTAPPPSLPRDDFALLATHLAIEAAAQRRALDQLAEAVTSGRDRDRDDFRATVASLAAELHESEAQLELMGAGLRERDRLIADQTAVVEGLERRLDETDVHVLNLEREREATKVHIQNLENQRDATSLHIQNLETQRDAMNEQLRTLEKERAATSVHTRNLEKERDASSVHTRNLEKERAASSVHIQNLENHRDAMNEQLSNLEKERAATSVHIQNLEKERAATSVHIRNLEDERDAMGANVRDLEGERDAIKDQFRNLESERDVMTAHTCDLEKECYAMGARVRNLESERDAMSVHIRNLEEERKATTVHVRNLEEEREATAVHVRNLESERNMTNAQSQSMDGARRSGALSSYARVKRKLLKRE